MRFAQSVGKRISLALLVASVQISQAADIKDKARLQVHQKVAESLRATLGKDSELKIVRSNQDKLGMTHVYSKQIYKGVPVLGGEVITHLDKNGKERLSSNSLFKGIDIDVRPALTENEAIAIARKRAGSSESFRKPPKTELVIYPVTELVHIRPGSDATAYEYRPVAYYLAYIVHLRIETPTQLLATASVINAKTGGILDEWDDARRALTSSIGIGKSQYYSDNVSINTSFDSDSQEPKFVLRDLTRGVGKAGYQVGENEIGNIVTAVPTFAIYRDSDDVWGDGQAYQGGDFFSENDQTLAVDAAYHIQVAWDMFDHVFESKSADGLNSAIAVNVHDSFSFFDYTCFCIYLDVNSSQIDTVAHEFSHGMMFDKHGSDYGNRGEAAALNESNSDVMGTMAEFYLGGGGYSASASTIPDAGGNWILFDKSPPDDVRRYMDKPSRDGKSPDAWYPGIGNKLAHFGNGPANRQFYFLSQGSSRDPNSDSYSSYLPGGMKGVGNDRAAKIHHLAVATYYTATTTYVDARKAHLDAARDLYGYGSPEYQAVMNSFAAIHVGRPALSVPLLNAVTNLLLD